MPLREAVELVLFGLGVGIYGTLVGAGGGFIVVPVLLLVYHDTPQQATGTSLAVVFFNALSGSLAYLRQRRVDYRTGLLFALAGIPGAIIGAKVADLFTSRLFYALFGLLLIALAAFLNLRPDPRQRQAQPGAFGALPSGWTRRSLTDASGTHYAYAFNLRNGIALSFVVGFFSSILGIGGGIIHVPALVFLFNFPAHLATATSHFVLAVTALVGSASHLALGHVLIPQALAMAVGVVIGAQIGAAVARRTRGGTIVRVLSLALVVVGLRLLYGAVHG